MLVFLYGLDSYRSSQKLKEIVVEYKAKHKSGLNFRQLEWSSEILGELKDFLSSFSMFGEKKLLIVKNACLAKKQEQQRLIELLEQKKAAKDNNVIMIFFEAGKVDKGELSSWLEKRTKLKEKFDSLTGAKLRDWTRKEIQKSGGEIENAALEKLIAFVGSDLWQMSGEIGKLISFKNGRKIIEEDVDSLVKSKYDPNIFATIDALANRNKNLAYKLMHQHLAQGENEMYILTMFVYQFRNLLQIKSLIEAGVSSTALAKKIGLHPFVIKKSWPQLKNFSQETLKKIYDKLLKLDIAVKRGKIDSQVALDLIAGEIAS